MTMTTTHITNFGSFDGALRGLADMDGYLPLAGAAAADHPYPSDYDLDADAWDDHVAECVAAVAGAERAIAEWQDEDRS